MPRDRVRSPRRVAQRGVTLAALMLVVAIMSIFLAAAAQQWSFIQRRELEKELIHRGERIQLAIFWWQSTGQPYPAKLEDITKGPKKTLPSIPWDPMTARFDREGKLLEGAGTWAFIREGDITPPPGSPTGTRPPREGESTRQPRPLGAADGSSGAGGIRGVHSKSDEESIGAWEDIPAGAPYSEWRFELMATVSATSAPTGKLPDIDYPPGFPGLRKPGGPPVPRGALTPRGRQTPGTQPTGGRR